MLKLAVAFSLCAQAYALSTGTNFLYTDTLQGMPLCNTTEQLAQKGKWIRLKQGEYAQKPAGKQPGCKENTLMWQPNTCSLPYHSGDIPTKPRRVIFIGDSVQDVSAESFAWFLNQQLPQRKVCNYDANKMRSQLLKEGYSQETAQHTVHWMQKQLTKGHEWWGCKAKVSYIPMHKMPDHHSPDMVKALMFAVKNFGEEPLGREDLIVMNWGLHMTKEMTKMDKMWTPALKLMLQEYKKWDDANDAPKLVWRQVSPQHWGGDDGIWTPALFAMATGCSSTGPPKKLDRLQHKRGIFPYENDKMFQDAVSQAGMSVDGVKIAFLPVWRATAERHDEHPTMDCTHFCTHGAVNRMWNSGLLALYQGMKQKEESIKEESPKE